MDRAALDAAIGWAAAEGWNPGLHDAAPFLAADPEGFLGGWLDGRMVACISVVRYPGDFGFLGFYIVHPDFRGQGHGLAIWRAGMARLEGCVVGLDGVVAQQENYRKSGFDLAWNNARFEGAAPAGPAPAGLTPLAELPFAALADFDRAHFPAPRDAFLSAWTAMPGSLGLAALEDGAVAGYGLIRPCRQGHKIGPLFARDTAIADRLFRGLAAGRPGPVHLDLPMANKAARALAQSHGMKPVFQTARMYRGPAPALPLERIYGVTSFELG